MKAFPKDIKQKNSIKCIHIYIYNHIKPKSQAAVGGGVGLSNGTRAHSSIIDLHAQSSLLKVI